MRVADVFLAFPLLIGAILIVTVVGQGVLPVILALAIFSLGDHRPADALVHPVDARGRVRRGGPLDRRAAAGGS